MIGKNEKISAKKIKDMKSDFGAFIWFDFSAIGYDDYTCYATGHCAIASTDKELRDRVAEVDPDQKYQPHIEKELVALIDSCSSGMDSVKWQNTGITVGDLKRPVGDWDADRKDAVKNGEVFTKGRGNIIFMYDGYAIEIVKKNFVEFLRLFSGSVSGSTYVYYSHSMDAIGIGYKGEYGLLMTAIR